MKSNSKELLECASKALNKMSEKRKQAEKETRHIIETICKPFVERDEYYVLEQEDNIF